MIDVITKKSHSWSIFLLGWGGLFAVMAMRRWGRLPILFWTQVLAVGFLVGCTFAPNLGTFTGQSLSHFYFILFFYNRSAFSHALSHGIFRVSLSTRPVDDFSFLFFPTEHAPK